METHLERIVARVRVDLAERKGRTSRAALERRAAAHEPRGFARALRVAGAGRPAVIAELKKASPSRGLIREDFEPVGLARAFAAGGAACLSVLTEERFFQGSLEILETVAGAVELPILRKDFMVEAWQVLEARAAGADAILLIVAALDDRTLRELAAEAHGLGLDVLCEVHDREEMARALGLEVEMEMVGVNSRDLKTLEVYPERHLELLAGMPRGVLRIAESGIRTHGDVERLRAAGFDGFLVGESLMREADPGAALAGLLGRDVGVRN